MAHNFQFTVTVATERTEGKFATRDEQIDAITEMLENANEVDIQGIGP